MIGGGTLLNRDFQLNTETQNRTGGMIEIARASKAVATFQPREPGILQPAKATLQPIGGLPKVATARPFGGRLSTMRDILRGS